MNKVPNFVKKSVENLYKNGMSAEEISKKLKIRTSTIEKILKNMEE